MRCAAQVSHSSAYFLAPRLGLKASSVFVGQEAKLYVSLACRQGGYISGVGVPGIMVTLGGSLLW